MALVFTVSGLSSNHLKAEIKSTLSAFTYILQICGYNTTLWLGCFRGWWGSGCRKQCPGKCISGHCFPNNGNCVWGCYPENCLNEICDVEIGVCTDGCSIGLDGES